MPGFLERFDDQRPAAQQLVSRRAQRILTAVHESTMVRVAKVQGESLVQTEKLHEVDHITREAMIGHAFLAHWRDTLSGGDPFLKDELRFFVDTARLAKGEIIADLMTTYCRESRS